MSQSFRVLEMLTSEEILNLLRYRLNDSQADVELEAQDYLASQHNGQDLRTESQFASFHDRPTDFYSNAIKFYVDLMGVHLGLPQLLKGTALLIRLAEMVGAKTFADWGAGAGRDCIAMARIGLDVTHVDVLGEGTELARWRYSQRGLPVKIADALDPPKSRFDIVSSFNCMEHLEDPVGVLGQMLSRLNPSGLLVLAVDFYNFDLDQPGPHLPKNFAYGGIMQMALRAVGMHKVWGQANPWIETAMVFATVWQKPIDLDVPEVVMAIRLRRETLKLLHTFRGFYDQEITRVEGALLGE
jgi:2-polyprenyl-3-methyl-5-hydroxy-6-metoxy-1,4-benzoquinol methylase